MELVKLTMKIMDMKLKIKYFDVKKNLVEVYQYQSDLNDKIIIIAPTYFRDKNNEEIYMGDILEYKKKRYIVSTEREKSGEIFYAYDIQKLDKKKKLEKIAHKCEIRGNVIEVASFIGVNFDTMKKLEEEPNKLTLLEEKDNNEEKNKKEIN